MTRDEAIEVIRKEDSELLQRLTHDELLAKIDENLFLMAHTSIKRFRNKKITKQSKALRAVVEKHTPFTPEFGGGVVYCFADDRPYPCPTIQAIEKELQ